MGALSCLFHDTVSVFKVFPGRSEGFYLTRNLEIGCGKESFIINGGHFVFYGDFTLLTLETREIFSEMNQGWE